MRNRFVLLALLLATLFAYAAARIYGGVGVRFLFGAVALLFVYEWIVCLSLPRRFDVSREVTPTRVQSGSSAVMQLSLRVPRATLARMLQVEDVLPSRLAVRTSPARFAVGLEGRCGQVCYDLTGLPRGVYAWSDVYIQTSDVFGLIVRRVRAQAPAELVVYPQLGVLGTNSAGMRTSVDGQTSRPRSQDDALRIVGIREFHAGDRLSRIHWPATARTGTLKTKEFERAAHDELTVMLDLTSAYVADVTAVDTATSAAASLVDAARRSGTPVALFAFGQSALHVPSVACDAHLIQCLSLLAAIEPDADRPTPAQPRANVGKTRVVVVTHGLDEERLRNLSVVSPRGGRLLLARVNPDLSAEERALVPQLAAIGWQVQVVPPPQRSKDAPDWGSDRATGA